MILILYIYQIKKSKLFGNSKNAVIYLRKIKDRYTMEITHITLNDLENAGFKNVKELPKNVTELLNEVLKDI